MAMQLQSKEGVPLAKGDAVTTFRGEKYILQYWEPPHKPEASGYVYISPDACARTERYYPGVIGARFVEVP